MKSITTIGLDIAKQVFQVHEADKASRVVLRQKLRRNEVCAPFLTGAVCRRHLSQRIYASEQQ